MPETVQEQSGTAHYFGNGIVNEQAISLILEPAAVSLSKIFNIFTTFAATDDSANRQEQDVEEWIGDFR